MILSLTDFAMVDKYCRLRFHIQGRINQLTKYFKYSKHIQPHTHHKFYEEINELKKLTHQVDEITVSPKNGETMLKVSSRYKDIRHQWQMYPKKFPDHCIKIFNQYVKTKYNPEIEIQHMKNNNAPPKQIQKRKEEIRIMKKFLENIEKSQQEKRKKELLNRLSIEIETRTQEGWYLIFNTLTVDNENLSRVFPAKAGSPSVSKKTKNYWTEYIRKCNNEFNKAKYGKRKNAKIAKQNNEISNTYFAVVERGSRNGRKHIHVLHALAKLPKNFSDPNKGRQIPNHREIQEMKKWWKYGNSSPIAVRLSGFDNFTKNKWRWPVTNINNNWQPIPEKPPAALVNYLGKYITKSYNDFKNGGKTWRTRISPQMARPILNQKLQTLPEKIKQQILAQPNLNCNVGTKKKPNALSKKLLMKQMEKKNFIKLYHEALQSPQNALIKRTLSLIQGTPEYSPRNYGNSMITESEQMDVYKHFPKPKYKISIKGNHEQYV